MWGFKPPHLNGDPMIATIQSLKKTVAAAGTAEPLASSRTIVTKVRIKALHGNTGDIYVGPSGVAAATGFVLRAGEELLIEAGTSPFDLSQIFIDASALSQGITLIYQ